MRTYVSVCIGLLICILLVGVRGDTAAQTTAGAPGRDGRFLGLSSTQARVLQRRIDSTVRERATLESAETVEIHSQIDGMILYLVPEGTVVMAGELLVKLDDSSIENELLKQTIAVAVTQATLVQTELEAKAAQVESVNRLAVADMAAKVADLDRKRCLAEGGELDLEQIKIESQITVAEAKRDLAQETLKRLQAAQEARTASVQSMRETELAVVEASAMLETAQAAKQLLTGHVREYRAAALELGVLEARSALSLAKIRAAIASDGAKAKLEAAKAALRMEEAKLAESEKQLESCCITSPCDGMVVYARGSSRTDVVIEEGASVRQRQPILQIPDMTRLQARLHVHETVVNRLQIGQLARVRFDAFPDRTFRGTVEKIAAFPEPASWTNANVKEYVAIVALEDAAEELRLGMTGEAEIVVSQPDSE